MKTSYKYDLFLAFIFSHLLLKSFPFCRSLKSLPIVMLN